MLEQNKVKVSREHIINVDTQIVSGVNYYITFSTPSGPIEVVVWDQPWNNHYEVTGINKRIKII